MTNQVDANAQASNPIQGTWTEPVSIIRRGSELCLWLLASAYLAAVPILILVKEGLSGFTATPIFLSIFALVLVLAGFARFREKEARQFHKELIETQFSYRLGESLPWLLTGFGGFPWGIWILYMDQQLETLWPIATLALVPAAYGIYLLQKKHRLVLSAHGTAAKEALEKEAPVHTASENLGSPASVDNDWPFNERWWIRYPLAIVAAGIGYYFAFEFGKNIGWLVAAGAWLWTAILIREVLLFALGAGSLVLAAWAVWAGVAALPVSVAVIVGALIIAAAIKNR